MDFLANWGFWTAVGGLTVAVAALMIRALIRGRDRGTPAAAYDLQVYRDQLREVDKDEARGVISAEEAKRLRTEVSRRVLEADKALQAADGGAPAPREATIAVGLVIAVLCLGAVWLYLRVGAPGYPDLPLAERLAQAEKARADRPSQATIEAEVAKKFTPPKADPKYVALIEKLRQAVAKKPDDLTGQQLLVQHEQRLGNFSAAWKAQQAINRIKGDKVTAQDWAIQADLMVIAADGYVSPETEQVLKKALLLDPKNKIARFYTGEMLTQTGRPDLAFRLWQPLMEEGPPDAPWVQMIRAQIGEIAREAGIRYNPPGMKGPSAADMAAAQDMTPEERQQMIRGMVQQLSDRLNTEGGSPQEWARLVGAYGVLGETDKQAAALEKARKALADNPDALKMVEQAAKGGGAPMMGGAGGQAPAAQAPALPGPTAEDMQAAGKMSAADRQQMIKDMVQRLADKLANEGGTAPEWARLINAYGVLGNTERAKAIWGEARTRFAGRDQDLALIRAAAQKAGVAE
ncbi:c-type cytochrome biogenesis protein CcmI [Acidimangrovimonas pyrenivorans]|uniref:C-type cytochrome biogenesis protein CcmI n=1 Tax=Acidimangrovimonas pyrenivorans TaxID=2030798 RepID=A0ABV7AEM6_9RHOB